MLPMWSEGSAVPRTLALVGSPSSSGSDWDWVPNWEGLSWSTGREGGGVVSVRGGGGVAAGGGHGGRD